MNFLDKFYMTEQSGITVFKSKNILSPHAFSTRLGGVSTDVPYKSLNLSYGRGDKDENVAENLRIFSEALGSNISRFVSSKQIHSANVYIVNESDAGKTICDIDGFVTTKRQIPISVSVADCVPILLEDAENKVVAALHAGWRGTVNRIAAVGVKKMFELGGSIKNINVAIGPCIHKCCYEVGEDFFNEVSSLRGKDFANRHIKENREGRLYADLIMMNAEILLEAGILPENLSVSSKCTACESEIFFSHRASKGVRGTMKAAIMLE